MFKRHILVIVAVITFAVMISIVSASPDKVVMHHYLGNGECQEKEVLPSQVADNPEWELGPCPEGTPEPTEESTVEPTEEVTEEPTPEVTETATVEPTEEVTPQPTEEATEEPTQTEVPEETETPRETATPAPTVVTYTGVLTITVWSNLPNDGVAWQIRGTDGQWHSVVDAFGDLIVTPIEHRDRFNASIGAVEVGVEMSRLVVTINNLDPHNFRAIDPQTQEPVGVWIEFQDEWCQDFYVCGVTVFVNN